ncbi:MAG TPA: prolyl oligopeptidase family serine peptidase [Acidimicrobiales bacterium]|nr:prolyl oligopeptidase family serine peptidase [Acidimicrobiales bacterium]
MVQTPRGDVVDLFPGEAIADPYRWLEDTDAPATRAWIEQQNEVTDTFLAQLPVREVLRARLHELWDYPRVGTPARHGSRWFQTRNSGLQNQPVLFVMPTPDHPGRELLDPNALSSDGTTSVPAFAVSDDGALLAYATSEAGSDWMTWHVRDVESGEDRSDVVRWSKFSVAAWRADGSGFFYSAMDEPEAGAELTGRAGGIRILFHALGTAPSEDTLVLEWPGEPEWIPHAAVSEDGRYLLVSTSKGTAPENRIDVLDLAAPDASFVPLVDGFFCQAEVVSRVGGRFLVLTDHGAERHRLVSVDPGDTDAGSWREVIGERDALLLGVRHCGTRLVCHYLEDACSALTVMELDGTLVSELPLPAASTVAGDDVGGGVVGRMDSDLAHFSLTSFVDPGSLWSLDSSSCAITNIRASSARIDLRAVTSERVFVTATDGARIPLFLTHRQNVAAHGDAPVLLYGYGGFGIPMTPTFSMSQALFVERGGVLAVAALRGGGEYGREWRDAGRLEHKQRVFDDFCDCARWLVTSGWSRPGRIAINGGSNGGLLVGACMTQHPELFGAAVPEVGVFDMLRFHLFTIGWAWKSDFGDPDDPEQFRWVRAYSPLHNVRSDVRYPPTLITTGDHDDRVVPGHSFKFAATLQAALGSGSGPVFIRVETSAGHGAGKPTAKVIDERADVLAFVDWAVGDGGGVVPRTDCD